MFKYFYFFYFNVFEKNNININTIKLINDFEMSILKTDANTKNILFR